MIDTSVKRVPAAQRTPRQDMIHSMGREQVDSNGMLIERDKSKRVVFTKPPQHDPYEVAMATRVGNALWNLHHTGATAWSRRTWSTRKTKDGWVKGFFVYRAWCKDCKKGGKFQNPAMHRNVVLNEPIEQCLARIEVEKAAHLAQLPNGRNHDVPDDRAWWVAHVLGYAQLPAHKNAKRLQWEEFHRGAYAIALDERGESVSVNVIWDFDRQKGEAANVPIDKARAVVARLDELGLRGSLYANSTHGGNGVHVRLCVTRRAAWQCKAFGEALLLSIGMKPGNNPANGETEVFPKQSDLGTSSTYGNLVGLPCGFGMMYEEKTNLLEIDSTWEKIHDWECTARILESVAPADDATFLRAFGALGLDENKRPAVKKASSYGTAPKPHPIKHNGRTTLLPPSNTLTDAVKAKISLDDYVTVRHGRPAVDGEKRTCLVHEPRGGENSFRLFTGRDGTRLWYCAGDCNGHRPYTGDVVTLHRAWLMRGLDGPHLADCTNQQALEDLARSVGIDPVKFRADEVEAKLHCTEFVMSTISVPHLIQCWVDETVAAVRRRAVTPEAANATLGRLYMAYSAVVVQAHYGRDEPLPNDVSNPVIAAAFNRATPGLMTITEYMDKTVQTRERLEAKAPVIGHAWIETTFGAWSLSKLLHALAYQLGRPMTELNALMPGRRYREGSQQHTTMKKIAGAVSPVSVIPVEVAAKKALNRTSECAKYKSDGYGDGHKVGTRMTLCTSFMTCRACNWVRAQLDYELATSEKKEHRETSWLARPQVHSVCMTVASTAEADLLIAHVTKRVKGPKLRSLGVTESGQITVRYSTDDEGVVVDIRAACDAWSVERERTDVAVYETSHNNAKNVERVTNDYMSLYRNTDRLIRMGEAGAQALSHWIWWTQRHRSISRSKKALPWPTREQAREAAREKKDDNGGPEYEGQKITWKLVHVRTGFVIAEQEDYPFTIDQAIRHAAMSTAFHSVLANNPVQAHTG